VLAKHGDEYDRFNYEGKRDASSLGDAIVVMLINRFADEVKNWLTDPSLGTCVSGLREVDNVRPILMIPVWINSLLNRTCTQSQAEVVKRVWDSLVDEFLNIPFVRERKSFWNCFNSVNELEWGLKFSQGVRIQTLSSVVESVRSWMHADDGSLAQKAFQDATSLSQAVDFIVCGHTHQFEIVPLQATIPRSQIYVNSGTWRRVYEEAQGQPGKHEFVGQDVMAYVALYAEHERSGRPFETWSGSLGPPVI
jgi:hypothetical protein